MRLVAFPLNILLNNPRNQPDCNIAVLINPGNNEAYFILFAGHAVIVAAVSYSIDPDMKADEDGAFVDVGYDSGIFALNLFSTKRIFHKVRVIYLILIYF